MNSTIVPTVHDIDIAFQDVLLSGSLIIPENAKLLVVFAHGSGSSRFSRRNRYVAEVLNDADIATLLFDLLTPEEEDVDQRTREFRFDIDLLTERLIGVIDYLSQNLQRNPATDTLPLGLFGASTGAAVALRAAAQRIGKITAVVSRGGRPDLARQYLAQVKAPTLLIVGGEDTVVIEFNQQAAEQLQAVHRLEIVPGATHLFEEEGKLEEVAKLARDWFLQHLSVP